MAIRRLKKVTFEPESQRVFIGDDIKVYVADGNQMIIDDMDREISDRIVLKKIDIFCKDLNLVNTDSGPFFLNRFLAKKIHTIKVAIFYQKSMEG